MKRVWAILRAGMALSMLILAAGCATVPREASQERTSITPVTKANATAAAAVPKSSSVPPATAATTRPSSVSAQALGVYRTPEGMKAPPSNDELSIVASAKTLIGMPPESTVVINGRQFILDCIGTVAAIFYREHIDITKDFALYDGTGVDRLYFSLKKEKVLHSDKYPRPGDVVIWDNTWDANENDNANDDPRTHAGVVLAVDDDGTIYYVHENYRRGVIIEVMNLLKPDVYQDEKGKLLNSPMAMAPKPGEERAAHWVSGDLFDTFGDVLGAKRHYQVASSEDGTALHLAESSTDDANGLEAGDRPATVAAAE
ncbi:MAG TPA: CHAP domain-containing protein [Spirochaetia bacterium]|nr:CHAP domain-containing protein [Spirochaetia bacterium]